MKSSQKILTFSRKCTGKGDCIKLSMHTEVSRAMPLNWSIFTHTRHSSGTSLVVQWLRACLLTQGTRARSLVREDSTRHGAAKPVCHSCQACMLQLLKPAPMEPALRKGRRHTSHRFRKRSHHREMPTQPKWRTDSTCCSQRKPEHPARPKLHFLKNKAV